MGSSKSRYDLFFIFELNHSTIFHCHWYAVRCVIQGFDVLCKVYRKLLGRFVEEGPEPGNNSLHADGYMCWTNSDTATGSGVPGTRGSTLVTTELRLDSLTLETRRSEQKPSVVDRLAADPLVIYVSACCKILASIYRSYRGTSRNADEEHLVVQRHNLIILLRINFQSITFRSITKWQW